MAWYKCNCKFEKWIYFTFMYLLTSIETHFKAVSYSETWCKTLMKDFLFPPPANYLIIINWKMLRTSQPLGANSGEMLNLDCRLETVINIIIIARNDEPSGQVNRPLRYLQALPIKKFPFTNASCLSFRHIMDGQEVKKR